MKTEFEYIAERLGDSFFESQHLGKDAVRKRIAPMDNYGDAPRNFMLIDWTPEDERTTIEYSFQNTAIGRLLLGSTAKGLCFLGFDCGNEAESKADFVRRFPKNPMKEAISEFQKLTIEYCNGNHERDIPLHLRGTDFQLGIWKQLMRIPRGRLCTYGSLIPNTKGARAIGSAVGANPVSYIVPCHRVVRNDGSFHGYHWGTDIKKQLLIYEFQDI